jgi:survival of motor neuron protein-interacting protein 1
MALRQQCLPLKQRGRKRSNQSEPIDATAPVEIASLGSMDAMEYLAFVKHQASSLPDVFVSTSKPTDDAVTTNTNISSQNRSTIDSTPIDGSAAARNYLLSRRLELTPPPTPAHAPPPSHFAAWKEETLSNFSSLRVYLHTCREQLHKSLDKTEKISVPQSKDIYAWHVFCLGNQIRNEMECKMIHVQINGLNISRNSSAAEIDLELEKYHIPGPGGYEPSTQLMSQFDQIIVRRLLSHHTRYIAAGCSVTVKRMRWIYAILARLEKPLHRDEASVLTELLRELCRVRALVHLEGGGNENGNENDEEEIVQSINVVIILIGAYFEQCTFSERLFVAR